jgi:type I restriction enzyme S subunit
VKWYGEGVFAREAKLGSTIAAKTLYGVQAGQFIYNRMFVTEGSFGTVPAELANGVVSNEFPVFDIDTSIVLPEWLHLYFRDPFVVTQVARQAEGGTKSRRRWKEEQFLQFEVEVPELEEQERVVRLARAFEELNEGLHAELAARRKQYEYYRDKLLTFEEAPA